MTTATTEVRALYELHDRQAMAMELLGWTPEAWDDRSGSVHELLYGGAAGGGKSHLIRCVAATVATQIPNSVSVIFRRTYPELEENMIRTFRLEVPRSLGDYNEGKHEFRWTNGSITEFRHCEREGEVDRYYSAEWDALLIDEATHFTEFMVTMLRGRVRSTKPGWYPTIVYGSNPGNVGHSYFKRQFVEESQRHGGQPWMALREHGGLRRAFLLSKLVDNPSLSGDYELMLEGISDPVVRRAMRDGDWSIFAGQFFSTWGYERHIVEPFPVPKYWRKWAGLDWGYAKPLSYGIYTQDPDSDHVYRIRELYAKELNDSEACERILATEATVEGSADVRLSDPSVWARKSESGRSTAEIYAEKGVQLTPANNDRVNGWRLCRDLLADKPDGRPGFQVFANCYEFIRTIPDQVYSKTNPEDMDTDGEDHAADEWRYAVSSRMAATGSVVTSWSRRQGWQRRR